jgi:NAD(P)-dependent dehydrogenase (short-subunit alcohol dehydrogenase family)
MTKNFVDLTGRVAVVIGGTSGLGRVIALGLAEAGADIVSSGRRADLVDEVARCVETRGRRTLRQTVDVSERESIDALRDVVLD